MSDTTSGGGGLLDMDPNMARNLLMFGAATMQGANARTPQGFLANGAGPLGAIGAGILGASDSARQYAQLQSQMNYQGAQTRQLNNQNQLFQQELPYVHQSIGNAMGGGSGGFGGGMPGGMPQMGGGNINQGAATGNIIPPGQRQQMVSQAVQGTDVPPELVDNLVDKESQWNVGAKGSKGEIGLGQIMPTTAQNPGFGTPGIDPNALSDPNNNLKFTATYLNGLGQSMGMKSPADWQDPQKVTRVLAAYNTGSPEPSAVGGAYASDVLARMRTGTSWQRTGQPQNYQVAQAGNGPMPMPGQPQQMAPQGQSNMGGIDPTAMAHAQQLYQQAASLPVMNIAGMGDINQARREAMLAQAKGWQSLAMAPAQSMASKGFQFGPHGAAAIPGGPADPTYLSTVAGNEAQAKAPYQFETARPGSVVTQGGKPVFSVPIQSDEIVTSGPQVGAQTKVFRNPLTGQVMGGQGIAAETGLPPGAVQTSLSPQQHGALANQPKITLDSIEHDRATIEGDLSHVIDNAVPAKQQLFQLRSLTDQADTGAAGQTRAAFKNWVQTFAPDFVSQVTGNASPAQEFNKIALMGAGKQERGDLGARGGFRAMEMYTKANPNLDMQPTANHDMANALLVTQQYHIDYAQGASEFYNKNYNGAVSPNNPQPYKPLSQYDSQYIKVMKPELYATAISAMNGKPYAEWSKGLNPQQLQVVGGILQRADPSATIDVGHGMVPVSKFTKTFQPTDVAVP